MTFPVTPRPAQPPPPRGAGRAPAQPVAKSGNIIRRGGDTIKRRETIYLPMDVAEAFHRASLVAGGYGEKTRIAEEAIRTHPEVRAQLEKVREERGHMTMERIGWQELRLLDTDGRTPLNVDTETRSRLLDEFRRTGGMHGAFFAPLGLPHEDPEDASTWGPASPDDVDWEGFDDDDDDNA